MKVADERRQTLGALLGTLCKSNSVLLIFLSHMFLSVSSMVRRNWKGTDRKMSDRKICPL